MCRSHEVIKSIVTALSLLGALSRDSADHVSDRRDSGQLTTSPQPSVFRLNLPHHCKYPLVVSGAPGNTAKAACISVFTRALPLRRRTRSSGPWFQREPICLHCVASCAQPDFPHTLPHSACRSALSYRADLFSWLNLRRKQF